MVFSRFVVEGLAHNSYLLASDETREALVIDPRRDVDIYLAFDAQHDFRVTRALETHVHADFVSGARELHHLGAHCISGPGADLEFEHTEVQDGDTIFVGNIRLTFLHTPGHTPEHISILAECPDQPSRLFTGDTLFVGSVGRPDLLGHDVTERLVSELYDSLFTKLLRLDDRAEVYPAHGAGSLCGRSISSRPFSTIGFERVSNSLLQYRSRQEFIKAVLAELPETPPYFSRMKRMNREGPPLRGLDKPPASPPSLTATEAWQYQQNGAILLDLRDSKAYGLGHPRDAINIGFGARLGYWAGWVIAPDAELVLLVADENQVGESVRQLLRVGLDRIAGAVQRGFDAWKQAGLPIQQIGQISPAELQQKLDAGEAPPLVDVRTASEFDSDHLPGAVHIPVGELLILPACLPRRGPVATICEGGYRSSLAASLIERAGITPVMNVTGGMAAFREL